MSAGEARLHASGTWDPAGNAAFLEQEAEWLGQILELRLKMHADEVPPGDPLVHLPPPDLPRYGSCYAEVVRRFELETPARLVLMLSFLPHIKPEALDPFWIQNRVLERRFTEFGGWVAHSHGGFLPSGETAMFLLAGDDLRARLSYHPMFHPDHTLYTHGILHFHQRHPEEPLLAAALQVTPEYRERLATGRSYQPPFSAEFPAQRITTAYTWDDLVLPASTRSEVEDIANWSRHHHELFHDWGLARRLKPGYRSLFYGPPGTGKTLTACLLGQVIGCPVYRVDLSKVVSKYIGETEKNLASLFDHAQLQDWLLFFDEADSLFGKRTESRSSNDRAANQQIAYLLQRIEDFPGIVILATNLRTHLDEAFSRRFQAMIHFPIPDAAERLRLWESHFVDQPYRLGPEVDLGELARTYELAGGSIVNVLRYSCLKAIAASDRKICGDMILEGIQREIHKEGKFLRSHR